MPDKKQENSAFVLHSSDFTALVPRAQLHPGKFSENWVLAPLNTAVSSIRHWKTWLRSFHSSWNPDTAIIPREREEAIFFTRLSFTQHVNKLQIKLVYRKLNY